MTCPTSIGVLALCLTLPHVIRAGEAKAPVAEPALGTEVKQTPTHAVSSGYVTVNGGRLFYEEVGHGPALIMIHDGLVHRENGIRPLTTRGGTDS